MDSSQIAISLQVTIFLVAAIVKYTDRNNIVWHKLDRLDICATTFIAGNAILQTYDIIGLLSSICLMTLAKASSLLTGKRRLFALLATSIVSLSLAIHLIPGFHQFLVFEEVISNNNLLFSLYLKLDKASVGILLFIYLVPNRTLKLQKQWVLTAILSPLFIVIVALTIGFQLDIKYGYYLLWFLSINLLVTCLAEEIFFRKIIQESAIEILPKTHVGTILSIVAVSYLFSLAHGISIPSSPTALLYMMASLLYAWVYQKTRSVELSIMAHFSMNISHIVLLPYPLF